MKPTPKLRQLTHYRWNRSFPGHSRSILDGPWEGNPNRDGYRDGYTEVGTLKDQCLVFVIKERSIKLFNTNRSKTHRQALVIVGDIIGWICYPLIGLFDEFHRVDDSEVWDVP